MAFLIMCFEKDIIGNQLRENLFENLAICELIEARTGQGKLLRGLIEKYT